MGPSLSNNRLASGVVRTIEGSEVREALRIVAELRRFESAAAS
jgi:hypothetical protein